jgi:hypothetical protein
MPVPEQAPAASTNTFEVTTPSGRRIRVIPRQ